MFEVNFAHDGWKFQNTGGQKEKKKYKAKQFRSKVTDGARDGQEPWSALGAWGSTGDTVVATEGRNCFVRLEIGPWQPSLVVVEAAAAPPHRVDATLTTEATPFAFAATEVEAEAGEDFLPSTVAGDTLRSQARA
jgi:uncharacterized lipoprotein NlpE involved in copper resistance